MRFKNLKYVRDPINAVKKFNDKEVDEIIILDINATLEKRTPNIKMINEIAGEAFMPLGYGGGITTIDEMKFFLGKYSVHTHSGTKNIKKDPIEFAKAVEKLGAGEIFLNFIDRDGTYLGYDFDLIRAVCRAVSIPVIVCGRARNADDFQLAVQQGASAVAAGSIFVFQGRHRAVLINFPSQNELLKNYHYCPTKLKIA